jgi:nucleoside-diphosphate-sugar epimerase
LVAPLFESVEGHEDLKGNVVLTGATGFLGGAIVRRLLSVGFDPAQLRCLVRDRERAIRSGIPSVCVRVADLGDPAARASLPALLDGASVVLHLAGAVKALSRADYDRANVAGTRDLVAAVAAAAPAAHFVLVSSLAAAGPSVDGRGSAAAPDACAPVSLYGDSKRRGELEVTNSELRWTVVRPPVVYGPGDAATRLLFRQAMGLLVPVPWSPQPLSVIHSDDVVAALLLVATRRPHGAVLPLEGPERTDTHALLTTIARVVGRRARLVRVPLLVARCGALAADALAALRRTPGFYSRDKVRELAAPGWVADASAAKALGWSPRIALESGLALVGKAEGLLT